MSEKKKHEENGVTDEPLAAFARCLLPSVVRYYETESGQRAYQEFDESGLDLHTYFESEQGRKALSVFRESMKNEGV